MDFASQNLTAGQLNAIVKKLGGEEGALRLLRDELVVSEISKAIKFPDGTITRRARVDRTRTPQQVVDATGRKQYVNKDVLATMPQGDGDEVDVWFIPTKRFVLAKEVPAFLAQYGLVPDPRAQAAVNEADQAFADKYPNGTQWGDNCFLAFSRWDDERRVFCGRRGYDWGDDWFLSGVLAPRK